MLLLDGESPATSTVIRRAKADDRLGVFRMNTQDLDLEKVRNHPFPPLSMEVDGDKTKVESPVTGDLDFEMTVVSAGEVDFLERAVTIRPPTAGLDTAGVELVVKRWRWV